jgi:hypothetical protein
MSEFRVEKRREAADVTLVTGATLAGDFFLAHSSPGHTGPERVGELLNSETGFFPFESDGRTAMINRAHVVKVSLSSQVIEPQLDAGYEVAPRQHVKVLLTTRDEIVGDVVVFQRAGHQRLSDYAHGPESFRYLELDDRTLLINSAHIVAMTEVTRS